MKRRKIQILPESISNRIAAGEIIERPASVVRELLDNALDAEASRIDVEIRGGGRSLIVVRDNGYGIDPDGLLLAFERHATSKIQSLDDLDSIHTLGFRGEALPSIASVSKMVIQSFVREEATGSEVYLEGGRIVNVRPCICQPGTTVTVRNLFYNVPVRRKFMRLPRTEYGHVFETIIDHALTFPGVHFVFRDGDRIIADTPAIDHWSARIAALFGKSYLHSMIYMDMQDASLSLQGYISSPQRLMATARSQRLYINGRRVRDRIVTQAVYRGYREYLSAGLHPAFIIRLDIPPEQIDVNVHPTKSEVRFRSPKEIFDIVSDTIRSALGDSLRYNLNPAVKTAPPGSPGTPQTHGTPDPEREIASVKLQSQHTEPQKPEKFSVTPPIPMDSGVDRPQKDGQMRLPNDMKTHWKSVGQLFNMFIFIELDEELLIIDQHTLHERLLFERFRKDYENRRIASQSLMFPVSVELDPRQSAAVLEFSDLLVKMGIGIEHFGSNAFLIRSLPEHLKQESPELLLQNIADELVEVGRTDRNKAAERKMLISLSCRRAIKAGDVLDRTQLEYLANGLFTEKIPASCPHGRPIFIRIGKTELEHRFMR